MRKRYSFINIAVVLLFLCCRTAGASSSQIITPGGGNLQATTDKGATTTTYVEAAGFVGDGSQITGVAGANLTGMDALLANLGVLKTGPTLTLTDNSVTPNVSMTLSKTASLSNEALLSTSLIIPSSLGNAVGVVNNTSWGEATTAPATSTTFAISAWVKLASAGGTGGTIVAWNKAGDTANSGLVVAYATSYICVLWDNAGVQKSPCYDTGVSKVDNTWHHYVVTGAAGTYKLWIDNAGPYSLSVEAGFAAPVASGTVYFAKNMNAGSSGTTASIDDIRIYDINIAPGFSDTFQVDYLYSGGVGTSEENATDTAHLLAHWKLDSNTAPLADNIGSHDFAQSGGAFSSVSSPGATPMPTNVFRCVDGTSAGEAGKCYVGNTYGSHYIEGREIFFNMNGLGNVAQFDTSGKFSIGTDSVQIGGAYQAMNFATASTVTMQGGWATAEVGFATVTATYTYTFPTGLISLNCITSVAYTHCYCVADSATDGRTSANCYLNDPAVADTRIYWQAWGR